MVSLAIVIMNDEILLSLMETLCLSNLTLIFLRQKVLQKCKDRNKIHPQFWP